MTTRHVSAVGAASMLSSLSGRISHQAAAAELGGFHPMPEGHQRRYRLALSSCAHALLSSAVDGRLEKTVEALLKATRASHVFIQRIVMDPELGLYASSPSTISSGLNIPIFVEGEWVGLIGLTDEATVREWTEEDLSLLTTTAAMIGAFWEREIMGERLEQAISDKNDFVASVSHEIRTPLASVLGFGQVLSEDGGTLSAEEHAELLGTIVRQAADLTNIVDDLLVSAKNDTGKLRLTLVPVTLRAQAAQALEDFGQDQIGHIILTGEPSRATGDPSRVRQIVRNLVSNALRYGGPEIRIRVCSDADTAKVLVCDNGSAIPTADRERIFEQYQRASNVVGPAESLGLGLSISRRLAEHMGGHLTYLHENDESIFELSLPKAE